MIYGIDLGTTYSLIGNNDILYTGLVASAVDLGTKQQTNVDAIGEDIIHSYKVNMTTGEMGKTPILCSSIVLKKLVDEANKKSGEPSKDVIISVPAKFTNTQREATWTAALNAGLNPRGLINEPTAAALYMCKDYKDLLIVYDLGGGTFDVTILDSRTGRYFVVATDGDGHLAGDNLDMAIAKYVLSKVKVPIILKTKENIQKLKNECRLAKEAITTYANKYNISVPELEVSYDLDTETYISLMKQTFEPTLDITREIMSQNLLEFDKPKLLFVGGSTADKYLTEWVSEELGLERFVSDENPSYIVAKGVSLYAEMVENGDADIMITDVTDRLSIELSTGITETIIEDNSSIPISETHMVWNENDSQYLVLNLYQGNNIMAIDNSYIGTLMYDYGTVMKKGEGVVEIEISVNRNGQVILKATDLIRNYTQDIKLVLR